MHYEGAIFRPPSESKSLLIQVTIGCSHNQCTFCTMYSDKTFRIRKLDDIKEDLLEVSMLYKDYVQRVFLCDGDAFIMKTADLIEILDMIYSLFPDCKRVGCYATPRDILHKSPQELKALREHGLGILYLGLESGSDEVLKMVHKGATATDMVKAAQLVNSSGIKLSVMIIAGLGGRQHFHEHAVKSAQVVNQMQPDYLGLLSLRVDDKAPLKTSIDNGQFQLLTPEETVQETILILENLELEDCRFSSSHITNYIQLNGDLPREKDRLLLEVNEFYEMHGSNLKAKNLRSI